MTPRSADARSVVSSASSKRTPNEHFEEEIMTLGDGTTTEYEEVVIEDDINANDAQSEYVEETVEDDFEEYTMKTMMSDIEEEYFEEYSLQDSQSAPGRGRLT